MPPIRTPTTQPNDMLYPCNAHAESIAELDKNVTLLKSHVDTVKDGQREMKEDIRSIKATQQEIRDDVRDFKADKRWAAAIAGATGSGIALVIQLIFTAFKS